MFPISIAPIAQSIAATTSINNQRRGLLLRHSNTTGYTPSVATAAPVTESRLAAEVHERGSSSVREHLKRTFTG
jgi:hypothetical protein